MTAIILSILLFGLIHPLSKIFLDSGVPLSFFCLSYVGIRLVIQTPILFKSKLIKNVKKTSSLNMLIGFGLVGAGLQFFEFKGIDDGLSPGTVTFLMFSYPIWLALVSLFIENKKKVSSIAAALFSAGGILLVTGGSLQEIQHNSSAILYPILASAFIALWIILSGKLRGKGMGTTEISVCYDLFSFVILLTLFSQHLKYDFSEFADWVSIHNAVYLTLYSICIGLLPNMLFYFGSKNISSYTASLAMAFEPVLSTLYSSIIWQYTFTTTFWAGASLIVLANLPIETIFQKLQKRGTLFRSLLIVCTFLTSLSSLAEPFDCSQSRPEMSGFHNMVLFGNPADQLYAYHLPLFAGQVNGESGHVLMHVYQGLFSIDLDNTTMLAYEQKFLQEQTPQKPIPFFSFSPRGDRFKVPEMICNEGFSTDVLTVFGHVESNPQFPAPEALINQLSTMTKEKTIFAQRFNGSSKDKLTYILFGTPQQYYLAHYLTDDENSFDQIVAIKSVDDRLKQAVALNNNLVLELDIEENPNLVEVPGTSDLINPNNKWKLPFENGRKVHISAKIEGSTISTNIEVKGEIYFNSNSDLAVK